MRVDPTHWRRFAKNHRTIKYEGRNELVYRGSSLMVWVNWNMKGLDNKYGEVTLSVLINDNWNLVEERPYEYKY